MGKISGETGVTYWRLNPSIHGYQGDKFKNNCGLNGSEIDLNFHFLRGEDIKRGIWDANEKRLVFEKVNGEKIIIEGVDPGFIIDTSGSTFDAENGTLKLILNGKETEITGFPTISDLSGYVTKKEFKSHECDNDRKFNAAAEAIDKVNENVKKIRDEILKEVEKELDGIDTALYENMPTKDIDRRKKGIVQRILDLEAGGGGGGGNVEDVFVDGLSALDKDKVAQIFLTKRNPEKPGEESFYEKITRERKSGENSLSSKISAETTARKSADSALSSKLSGETAERKNEDAKLTNQIKNIDSALTSEIKNRKSNDDALSRALTDEAKARSDKDNELEEAISHVTVKIEPNDTDINISLDEETKITYIGIKGISNPEITL